MGSSNSQAEFQDKQPDTGCTVFFCCTDSTPNIQLVNGAVEAKFDEWVKDVNKAKQRPAMKINLTELTVASQSDQISDRSLDCGPSILSPNRAAASNSRRRSFTNLLGPDKPLLRPTTDPSQSDWTEEEDLQLERVVHSIAEVRKVKVPSYRIMQTLIQSKKIGRKLIEDYDRRFWYCVSNNMTGRSAEECLDR